MTDWGQIIHEIMSEKGIGTRRLAEVSGVGRSSIRRLLRGSGTTLETMERIVGGLGYKLDLFIAEDER